MITAGMLAVSFCLILAVIYYLEFGQDNDQPSIVYHFPERTGNSEINTGRLPYIVPKVIDTVLVEPNQIEPAEEIVMLDEFTEEILEYEECCEEDIFEISDEDLVVELPDSVMPKTLGDLLTDQGVTHSELEEMTSIIPIDPHTPVDSAGEFVQHIINVVQPLIDQFEIEMSKTTVEEGRMMIELMANDPTLTSEEYEIITQELFPMHVQDALRKEGLIR